LSATYGLQPEQITFFDDEAEPFFDRKATAVLIHALVPGVVGIEDDLATAPTSDTLAVKYRITFEDGSFAASTAMVNLGEKGDDDKPLSIDQVKSLATAKAARSALTNRGISLMRLHEAKREGGRVVQQFSGPPRGEYERLLREAHALGKETGVILDVENLNGRSGVTTDKTLWYRLLGNRYRVDGSNQLDIDQLRDFVAFLRSQLPSKTLPERSYVSVPVWPAHDMFRREGGLPAGRSRFCSLNFRYSHDEPKTWPDGPRRDPHRHAGAGWQGCKSRGRTLGGDTRDAHVAHLQDDDRR
jgi:hypothetical protein